MRIRRFVALVIVSATLLLSGVAQADEFGRRGLYVGVNGAYGLDLLSTELAGAVGIALPPVTYDNSWGLNARVGYRAFSFLALEAEYEWMEGLGINVAGLPLGTYKPHTLTGNVKLILPTWRFQPYLIAGAGVAFWSFEIPPAQAALVGSTGQSGTGFGFRGGAGLDVYLTEALSLNAEGTAVLNTEKFLLGGTQTNLYYFSFGAGLTYHF